MIWKWPAIDRSSRTWHFWFVSVHNLLLIEHKEYILLPLASIFHGVSNLKTKQIESVNF